MDLIKQILYQAVHNSFIRIIIVAIILDTILGVGRAVKEHKFNSSVGIDGAIRKVMMLVCLLFLLVIDNTVKFNLIGFIPETVREYIGISEVGLTEFFAILYIMYESVSILKNMALCGLPMPKKFRETILKFLDDMTAETKHEGDENDKVLE